MNFVIVVVVVAIVDDSLQNTITAVKSSFLIIINTCMFVCMYVRTQNFCFILSTNKFIVVGC